MMQRQQVEKQAFGFFIFALMAFGLMQILVFITKGAASQEVFEVFSAPQTYTEALVNSGNSLRIMLFLDVFFMIGYGGGLSLTAYANAPRNPVFGWVTGIGIAGLLLLDLSENLIMLHALDLAQLGGTLDAAQIGWQVGISGAKWLIAALSVVALTFILPQNTLFERLLVWSARIALPIGTGLFVTGAFDARLLGGLFILVGMGGGFGLLALTIWQRRAL